MTIVQTLKQLGYDILPLDKLVKADWNYKQDDIEKTAKLEANLKRNGQIENLIVRELDTGFYEIINGNHRYDVLKNLGIKFAVVNNKGKISKQDAIRLAIETNETKFVTDTISLAELIKELSITFDVKTLAETMPYTEEQLEEMIKLTDFDWNQFNQDKSFKPSFKFIINFENEVEKDRFLESYNQMGGGNITEGQIMIEAIEMYVSNNANNKSIKLNIENKNNPKR